MGLVVTLQALLKPALVAGLLVTTGVHYLAVQLSKVRGPPPAPPGARPQLTGRARRAWTRGGHGGTRTPTASW